MPDMLYTVDYKATPLMDASTAINHIRLPFMIILLLCPTLSTVLHNIYLATVLLSHYLLSVREKFNLLRALPGGSFAMAIFS